MNIPTNRILSVMALAAVALVAAAGLQAQTAHDPAHDAPSAQPSPAAAPPQGAMPMHDMMQKMMPMMERLQQPGTTAEQRAEAMKQMMPMMGEMMPMMQQMMQMHQMMEGHGAMMGQGHGGAAALKGDTGPASRGFAAANAKMHQAMDVAYTGNPDIDFVQGMIPHHQGAIDMARVVLEHGKNAEVRKLAQEVIKAQEGEIAWMRDWLKKLGN